MTADMMNAVFEGGGVIAVLNHCRLLYADKKVNGISILSTIFFTSWGFWNVYYYPSLSQWWSFGAGILLASSNVLWVLMMLHYRKLNKNT